MKCITLVCSDSLSSRLVAQLLNEESILQRIVITRPKRLAEKIHWRMQRHGPATVCSQILAGLSARLLYQVRGGPARASQILAENHLAAVWPVHVERTYIDNVNSDALLDLLLQQSPDLVVINGTDILHERILTGPKVPFVNIHCGLTPAYRGVHGGFWALWEGRPEQAGVTLHYVDPGVDTGRVIAQARIPYQPSKDGLLTLPLLQYVAALPLLRDYVRHDIATGSITGPSPSRQWFYPTWRAYLKMVWRGQLRF